MMIRATRGRRAAGGELEVSSGMAKHSEVHLVGEAVSDASEPESLELSRPPSHQHLNLDLDLDPAPFLNQHRQRQRRVSRSRTGILWISSIDLLSLSSRRCPRRISGASQHCVALLFAPLSTIVPVASGFGTAPLLVAFT